MKIIGLLGGMSWESTAEYYRIINQRVRTRLGDLHSAKIALYSVDFAEVEKLQHDGEWNAAAQIMIDGAKRVEAAGADCLLICTNTMHKLAEQTAAAIKIPLVHIADATASRIKEGGISHVALLGTRFTMEENFYRGRLEELHEFKVSVPNEKDRETVHRTIYDELCKGIISQKSRNEFIRILNGLGESGCEAVILGCTEIGLLIKEADSGLPIFDTTLIHAEAAVDFALAAL